VIGEHQTLIRQRILFSQVVFFLSLISFRINSFVDLLAATEDLLDFSINVFDTIRLQTHFNDRNRRISLSSQLKDIFDAQKPDYGFVDLPNKPCQVTSTLKYDLSLYLDRILQACKRTKANLTLLRVSRVRSPNSTLLVVASTNVRLEQLNKKVQLLVRLIKDNGGEFLSKKKTKKTDESTTKTKQSLKFLSKEDLNDYVEIALSFRSVSSLSFVSRVFLSSIDLDHFEIS